MLTTKADWAYPMTDSRNKKAAAIQESIREILYNDWDPISVCDYGPKDEYDSYIAPVYWILVGSRSEDELIDILRSTGLETICMSGDSREPLRPVARKLLDLEVGL